SRCSAWTPVRPLPSDLGAAGFAGAAAGPACAALGLYLDSRGQARWARRCFGIAVLVALPCGLLALVLAAVGDDLQMQLAQAAAGGGSIAGALSLAARYGLFAAGKSGLGGRLLGRGA